MQAACEPLCPHRFCNYNKSRIIISLVHVLILIRTIWGISTRSVPSNRNNCTANHLSTWQQSSKLTATQSKKYQRKVKSINANDHFHRRSIYQRNLTNKTFHHFYQTNSNTLEANCHRRSMYNSLKWYCKCVRYFCRRELTV